MLRASWLGNWKPPWGFDQGRRWGDGSWALAAIAQAWLLGGREGRWPRLEQEARRSTGPWVVAPPTEFSSRPPLEWIAKLRHGSAPAPPAQRGLREDEIRAWAWEALLEGDGQVWMALGSLLLDQAQRLRWIPLLGAVNETGALLLPPFLASLVPEKLAHLPQDWWECLLSSQDATGRLLPQGSLDPSLPWAELQRHGEPLVLASLPPALEPYQQEAWLCSLSEGAWMLDPRVRAWTRGLGPGPGLAGLLSPTLALGARPEPPLAEWLDQKMPQEHPPGWKAALQADLEEDQHRPELPPPSGHPTWDRLRMRWGGAAAAAAPGYPAWDTLAHPCADPFHWLAQGLRFSLACEPGLALRAFTLAHAHFQRLGARAWGARAASNAAYSALRWADLPAHARWVALRGELPQPWRDLEAAQLAEVYEEPPAALARIRAMVEAYPDFTAGWGLLAGHGLDQEDWGLVREGLAHTREHPFARVLEALLEPELALPPTSLDPETHLTWEAHRLFRGQGEAPVFWAAWERCPAMLLRLEMGLQVLERLPALRSALRLLALQAIADRAASVRHQGRLKALWPQVPLAEDLAPERLLKGWLAQRRTPTWIVWMGEGPHNLGVGEAPPEGTLSHLARQGGLAPFRHGDWVWEGRALIWEGATVGALLLAQPLEAVPTEGLEPNLIAPWVARLCTINPPPADTAPGLLLSDGSEPMASLLRELDRVARSELPVLILGPTGSGKELAARELHQRSGRSGRLVAVNCSEFAEGLMESELFGHMKGAFTGADRERRGAIEMASGGTLFLDEVADLSPRLQSLLLRVLQEREIRRVGSDHAIKVDVRFAAATHRPVEELATAGSLRRDLLFRLQGAVLSLPSLSERRHEFPYLIPRLVRRAALALRHPVPALAPGLPQALARLPWPGNVRELLHALERAVLRCEDGILKIHHFPELQVPTLRRRTWEEATRGFQRQLLLNTLRACEYSVAEAAESLGLARPALYATAKRLGVDLVAERLRRSRD